MKSIRVTAMIGMGAVVIDAPSDPVTVTLVTTQMPLKIRPELE